MSQTRNIKLDSSFICVILILTAPHVIPMPCCCLCCLNSFIPSNEKCRTLKLLMQDLEYQCPILSLWFFSIKRKLVSFLFSFLFSHSLQMKSYSASNPFISDCALTISLKLLFSNCLGTIYLCKTFCYENFRSRP